MSRRRTFVFAATATLLGLAVLEGVARLVQLALPPVEQAAAAGFVFEDVWAHTDDPLHVPDADLFWKTVPGRVAGEVRINRDGCRGPEIAASKAPGVRRLVLLGDSVTFGFGVREDLTFAGRLRSELGPSFEVIDAGITGYSSWQGQRWLEANVEHWKPDVVVVLFGYNDHHSAVASDRAKHARRHLETTARIAAKSALFQVASAALGGARRARLRAPVTRVPLDEFEANLLAIAATARRAGATVLFLTVPIRPDLPLVENFVAVQDPADPAGAPTWVRQIDFACQQMGDPAGGEIAAHFFDGEDLAPFVARTQDCERAAALVHLAPELPIFRYLIARCLEPRDTQAAAQAWRECRRLDRERELMAAYNSRLRELGSAGRLDVRDLAARFEAAAAPGLFLDVVHPSAAGHALVAAAIRDWLPEPATPR